MLSGSELGGVEHIDPTSLAILLAMSDTMPLAKVKDQFSEVVEEVERTQRRVTVTKHGRGAVVLIAVDDLESLEATIEVGTDPAALAAIAEARAEHGNGGGEVLDKAEALRRWTAPGA